VLSTLRDVLRKGSPNKKNVQGCSTIG